MMKLLTLAAIFIIALNLSAISKGQEFYQIQTFRLKEKSQEKRVDNYLEKAYLPALHRAGIKSVGVFKPVPSDTLSGKQIIVWLPFSSLKQMDKIQAALAKDVVYKTAGADFLNAPYDNVPFLRIESILLKAFADAPSCFIPSHKSKPSERIYELRSYEGPTEHLFRQKVKMFNQGGEIRIFNSLDFNAVFYAEVISGSSMPNLMYLTTFSDMASHNAHWDAFRKHPDWKKLSALDEYKHTVSRSVIRLLYPTEYSDF